MPTNDISKIFLRVLYEEISEGRLEADLGLALRAKAYQMRPPVSLSQMETLISQFLPRGAGDGLVRKLREEAEKTQV